MIGFARSVQRCTAECSADRNLQRSVHNRDNACECRGVQLSGSETQSTGVQSMRENTTVRILRLGSTSDASCKT